jgi:ankyrin repeat protein
MANQASRGSRQDAASPERNVKNLSEWQPSTQSEGFSFLAGMGSGSARPGWVNRGPVKKLLAGLKSSIHLVTVVLVLALSPLLLSYIPSLWRYAAAGPSKPTLAAAAASDVTTVSSFLAAGISPNARDKSDETALIAAASRGDMDVVKALLQGGADLNANVRGGYTALLLALINKHDEVADVLVAQPSLDLNARGSDGVTPLMIYVWRRRGDVVEELLQRGAEVHLQEHDGDTALHAATTTGDIKVLQMLLAKGANPNLKNKLGGTPLMWAAVYGYQGEVSLLLANGADPRLKDNDEVTAARWADRNKHPAVAELLREAEKRIKSQ